MLDSLHSLGMLRREKEPDGELVAELFRSVIGRVSCSACGKTGLSISPADRADDETWGMGRRCESCGQPIPPERVQLLPHVKRCVSCQQASESGASGASVEYCGRCGAVLTTRLRPGDGVTRYESYCAQCGKRA